MRMGALSALCRQLCRFSAVRCRDTLLARIVVRVRITVRCFPRVLLFRGLLSQRGTVWRMPSEQMQSTVRVFPAMGHSDKWGCED